jgi:hypothetical protein
MQMIIESNATRVLADKTIGESNLRVFPIGIGAISWSNSRMWSYGSQLSLDAGVDFF